MMLMPADHNSNIIHYFAGKYEGKIGWLLTPKYYKRPPFYMPYAIDNGAFTGFDETMFKKTLENIRLLHSPLWVLVPDVVGNRERTIELWHQWKDYVSNYGYRLAFACQDGMTPDDVPKETYCAFIGGSTEFKLNEAHKFKGVCEWLHIGRVNTGSRLAWAERIGADSVDGTGFFRGYRDSRQFTDFIEHFEGSQQTKILYDQEL